MICVHELFFHNSKQYDSRSVIFDCKRSPGWMLFNLFSNSQWSSVSSYEHVAVFDKYNVGSVRAGVLFCWRVCGERLMVETSEVIIEESKYLQLSSENTSLSLYESRCL